MMFSFIEGLLFNVVHVDKVVVIVDEWSDILVIVQIIRPLSSASSSGQIVDHS